MTSPFLCLFLIMVPNAIFFKRIISVYNIVGSSSILAFEETFLIDFFEIIRLFDWK